MTRPRRGSKAHHAGAAVLVGPSRGAAGIRTRRAHRPGRPPRARRRGRPGVRGRILAGARSSQRRALGLARRAGRRPRPVLRRLFPCLSGDVPRRGWPWAAPDKQALKVAGADEHGAKARATGLAGLELAVLALGGWGGAIAVLASGLGVPPPDFSLPWAIIPVPATLIGFWAAERYRDRFRGRRGWRGAVGVFLEAVHLIRELFVRLRWGWAMLGMALFWAADAFALWAGLAAFGTRMNAVTLLVGYATGMVFTRRTAPLAGAGILALALTASMWYSGAPLAAAVAGVFAYRILVLWLPLPVALAFLPTLRTMGERRRAQTERKAA